MGKSSVQIERGCSAYEEYRRKKDTKF